jgi:SAM-dependent methyltransferase
VGLFAFTWPSIQIAEIYTKVLDRVKGGHQLLDLGCGFGQNIRWLIHDGAPSENVAGADISPLLVDCGYEYFKDQEKLKSKFFIGDVLDSQSPTFIAVKESFDIVFASMVYHLWGWDDHIKALIQTVKLLKPLPGSIIFGWQLGASPAGEVERRLDRNRLQQHKNMYQHDEESWIRMWKEVEAQTGTNWEVQVKSVVTPETKAAQNVMPIRPGSTLAAVFFAMTRL